MIDVARQLLDMDTNKVRDHIVFIKHYKGKTTILIVYGDHTEVIGNDEVSILKKYLAKEFEIKDPGRLHYFLGIEVAWSSKGIFVSQRKYILDLLTQTWMLGFRHIDSQVKVNPLLKNNNGEVVEKGRYQRLVGRLIYLSHTCPNIAKLV